MEYSCRCVFIIVTILSLQDNVLSRLSEKGNTRGSLNDARGQRRVTKSTANQEKETNKLVLAALYGGLGLGIPSSTNFDYANGLNTKIQNAGGYGLPSGIYSYAFDPKTGMPFICDPTKTPSTSASSPGISSTGTNPVTAAKPVADLPEKNLLYHDARPTNSDPNQNKGGVNSWGDDEVPVHRLSPIEPTSTTEDADEDEDEMTSTVADDEMEEDREPTSDIDDESMNSRLPSNHASNDVTSTPSQNTNVVTTAPPAPGNLLHKPLQSNPVQQPNDGQLNNSSRIETTHAGNSHLTTSQHDVNDHEISRLNPSGPDSQSTVLNPRTTEENPEKINSYHKGTKEFSEGTKKIIVLKRSNAFRKYIHSKTASRKNGVTIKLPEIPACPDMKNYHWPWNCLEKESPAGKRACIFNNGRKFSLNDIVFPNEDYSNTDEYIPEQLYWSNLNYY